MIASQMGCDQTEALNHILWTARQAGFSFSSPLPSAPVHPPQTQRVELPQLPQPIGVFTPFQEVQPVPVSSGVVEDEVISRFIKLGLDEF